MDHEPGGRADRRRNRGRIVDAARSVILAKGRAAGMDEIAAEAGLAVGTLYRHFPAKDDLVDAILLEIAHETNTLVESFEERLAAAEGSAIGLLEALLRAVVLDLSTTRVLRETLDGSEERLSEVRTRATTLLAGLVTAARQDGSVRPEVTVEDLILVLRTIPAEKASTAERERLLQIMLHGLRTPEVDDGSEGRRSPHDGPPPE